MRYLPIILILLISRFGYAVDKFWVGGTGDWDVATNWDPVGVPTFNDFARINTGAVTILAGTTAQAEAVSIAEGASLKLEGLLEIDTRMSIAGLFQNEGGEVIIQDVLFFDAVSISATGVCENNGTIQVLNGFSQLIDNLNLLINGPNGIINLSTNSIGSQVYNADSILNAGNIKVSGSAGDGLLNWIDGFILNSGSITIDTAIAQHGIDNWGSIENTGTITVRNSGLNFDGISLFLNAAFTNSGTIDLNTDINGNGIRTLSEASFINTATGTIRISDVDCNCGGSGIENEGSFINLGVITVTAGTTFISNSAIRNWNSGTFDNQGRLILGQSNFARLVNTGPSFTNSGTILIPESNSGFGAFLNFGTATFTNNGLIQIDSDNGFTNDAGAVFINNDSIITKSIFSNFARFTNGPVGMLQIDSNYLQNRSNTNQSSTGVFLNQGILQTNNGFYGVWNAQGASLENQGIIKIKHTSSNGIRNEAFGSTYDSTYFDNSGTILIDSIQSFGIYTLGDARLVNTGTISINNTGFESIYYNFDPGAEFLNFGTIDLGPSIGTEGRSSIYISGNFNNMESGKVYINGSGKHGLEIFGRTFSNAGALHISGNIPEQGIQLVFNGSFENKAGAELQIQDIGLEAIFLDKGTVTNAGKLTFGPNLGAYALLGAEGLFSNQSTGELWGTGVLDGEFFENLGHFKPGFSPGTFTIDTFYDHSQGTFDLEIAGNDGPGVPNGHDQLRGLDTVRLGGTLIINLIDGFVPNIGETYTILTCDAGCFEEFASVSYPFDSTHWELTYRPNEVLLTYKGEPLRLEAGLDTLVCAGEILDLFAVATGGDGNYTYKWDINPNNGADLRINPTENELYEVTVIDGVNQTATDSVRVEILQKPTLALADTFSICPGDSIVLEVGPFETYRWSTNDTTSSVTLKLPGTYQVTVTDSNGCSSTDTIVLTELPAPSPTINGDSVICPDNTVVLDAGLFDSYQWSTGDTTRLIEVSEAGLYDVLVVENGCSGATQFEIRVSADSLTAILPAVAFCSNASTRLEVGAFASYQWSTGATTPTILVDQVGEYGVSVTNLDGCSYDGRIEVVADQAPEALISASQTEVCLGASITLFADGVGAFRWEHSGNPINTLEPEAIKLTPDVGLQEYLLFASNGCGTDTASILVQINPVPDLSIAATPETIAQGASSQLEAQGADQYVWTGSALSCSGCPDPLASPIQTTLYQVVGRNLDGCSDTLDITVVVLPPDTLAPPPPVFPTPVPALVDCNLAAVNVITPNGDGVNDALVFGDLSFFKESKLTVFNRWGQTVFETLDYQNDWQGTYQDTPLPAGTYLYLLALRAEQERCTVSNTVTIIRP